jgi:hypothetical protein
MYLLEETRATIVEVEADLLESSLSGTYYPSDGNLEKHGR